MAKGCPKRLLFSMKLRVAGVQSSNAEFAAADRMDKYGPKEARDYISMVKIIAPQMALDVANRAIQAFGGAGFTQDTPLAHIYMTARYCQVADGPDEVHMSQLARRTIRDLY